MPQVRQEETSIERRTDAAWHAISAEEALEAVGSSLEGLDSTEAAARLERFGPNALVVADPVPAWRLLVAQGRSLIVLLLVVASGVALLIGDLLEASAIGAVLVANASIGFWVEWQARGAMEALRKIQVNLAVVIREGSVVPIDAREVVPGDLIVIEAGEAVPADARLLSVNELRVVEAPLTGESVPVSKHAKPIGEASTDTPLADRACMVYKGTLAAAGSGRAVVVGTGSHTQIGRIAELVQATESEETPLEVRLDALGRRLVWITLGITLLVIGMGILRGSDPWLMVQTGIALAIAAVPEGLPVIATITLALGMRRMAQRHALVRSLPAVESLGSATLICADKTGTLTSGQMTATRLVVAGSRIDVSGTGLATEGEFELGGRAIDPRQVRGLEIALKIGVMANRAQLSHREGRLQFGGDPTEGALLILGRKAGLERQELLETYSELGELPFTSERRMMATLHRDPAGGRILFAKGAPGRIVEASGTTLSPDGSVPLDRAGREALIEMNRELGKEGLRVLALAFRHLPDDVEVGEEAVCDLQFVGFVGIEDPPAEGVKETIQSLRQAGVRTVMITGDQTVTAEAVAKQLGLDSDRSGTLEGSALARMNEKELAPQLEQVVVFSRTEPADKLRIVRAFQQRGEIVAMLGDGVNDAPALKRADIGVAMGGRGTDVAKETAGLVLQDDRFETIGVAVQEGRVVFDNIRKFVLYLFSCNLSEVLVILGAGVVGLPLPLLPLQILWLNLVTDVFPALALGVEPPEDDVMARPPRPPDAAILSRPFLTLVLRYSGVITAATLAAFIFTLRADGTLDRAITVAFMTLALTQLFHVFNARSHAPVIFSRRLFQNGWIWSALGLTIGLQLLAVYLPPLSRVLETVPLSFEDWAVVGAAAGFPLLLAQLSKLLRRGALRPTGDEGVGAVHP